MFILSQIPVPSEGENAWMWLCAILIPAIGVMWKQHNDASNAEKTELRSQRDKERERNDVLVNSIPEMAKVMAEVKNAMLSRPPE